MEIQSPDPNANSADADKDQSSPPAPVLPKAKKKTEKQPVSKRLDDGEEPEEGEDLEDGEIIDEEEDEEVVEVKKVPKPIKKESSSSGKSSSKDKHRDKSEKSSEKKSREKDKEELDPVKRLLAVVKEKDAREKEEREKRRKDKKRSHKDDKDKVKDNKEPIGKKNRKVSEGNDEGEEFLFVRGVSTGAGNVENWVEVDDRRGKRRRESNEMSPGHRNRRGGVNGGSSFPSRNRFNERPESNRQERREPKSDIICAYFMQGKCQKSAGQCYFSHDVIAPRKLELCKFWMMDCCAKEENCLYFHNDFPCKYFHTGLGCRLGDKCKFSHSPLTDVTRQVLLKHIGTAPNEILADFPRLTPTGAPNLINKMEAKLKGIPYVKEENNENGKLEAGIFGFYKDTMEESPRRNHSGGSTQMPSNQNSSQSQTFTPQIQNMQPPLMSMLPPCLPQRQQKTNQNTVQTQVSSKPEEPKKNWYSDDKEDYSKKKEELSSVLNQIRQQPQQSSNAEPEISFKTFFENTDRSSTNASTDFKDVDLRTSAGLCKKINILPATEINASLNSHEPRLHKVLAIAEVKEKPDYSSVRQSVEPQAIVMDRRLGPRRKRNNSIPAPASSTDQSSDGLIQPMNILDATPVFNPRTTKGGGSQPSGGRGLLDMPNPFESNSMPGMNLHINTMKVNYYNNPFNRDPRGPGGDNNTPLSQPPPNPAGAAQLAQNFGFPFLQQPQAQGQPPPGMDFSTIQNHGMRMRPPFMLGNQPQPWSQQQPPPLSSWERLTQGYL